MAEFILKDWYGKEKSFDHETVYFQDAEGNLLPFTHGTGASPDVRYVTFMSYDGLVEYGKKAVAVGDDCADPIARGVFDTPTRESDVQYNYTFYGWATEPNGGADANALKAVNEDKTVYANFSKAVRYYTITYYDSDGTTVLKTESLAYGSTPSYTPTKSGYDFVGWEPKLESVTGNASYAATWTEEVSFATASWARIAELSESGMASTKFAIGDTKTVTLTYADGTSENIKVAIAGFNHDELADGTGKAGISIVCMTVPSQKTTFGSGSGVYYYHPTYATQCSNVYKLLENTIKPALPSELIEVIKPAAKLNRYKKSGTIYTESENFNLWALSLDELGYVLDETTGYTNTDYTSLGTKYDLFSKVVSLSVISSQNIVKITTGSTFANYWTRHLKNDLDTACIVSSSGTINTKTSSNFSSSSYYVRFGFCI